MLTPVSGARRTHGSTLELHYTAIGPITIITALKPQQFVSGMHRRSHRAFGPAEQQHPPLSSLYVSFSLSGRLSSRSSPPLVTSTSGEAELIWELEVLRS